MVYLLGLLIDCIQQNDKITKLQIDRMEEVTDFKKLNFCNQLPKFL